MRQIPRDPKADYAAKLRDPRWQRRRLEIMQRDDFTCQGCGDKTTELNVHHRWYESGKDPWEYEDIALVTTCRPCHETETQERALVEQMVIRGLRMRLFAPDLARLHMSLLDAMDRSEEGPRVVAWAIHKALSDPKAVVAMVAAAFPVTEVTP